MITVPATEMAVRDWLRDDSAIVAICGNDTRKIDVEYSGDTASTHLTVRRVGGAVSSVIPLDTAIMVFDCWGRGRGAALNLVTALAEKLVNSKEVQLNDDAYLRGWTVESNLWLPDPTGQARYILTATGVVSARASV